VYFFSAKTSIESVCFPEVDVEQSANVNRIISSLNQEFLKKISFYYNKMEDRHFSIIAQSISTHRLTHLEITNN